MSTPDDSPVPLKVLFGLMGLVTMGLIAGVIYTKLYRARVMSVGEQRAIDRTCDNNCATLAKQSAERLKEPAAIEAFARSCVSDCQQRMYRAVRENRSPWRPGAEAADANR